VSAAPSRRPASLSRAAATTYGTNVAVAVLSLANVLIVGRVLGPSGRGTVAFLTTVAYLVSQLATLGIPQANVNISAREPETTPRLATNSILAALVGGVAAAAIVDASMAAVPALGGPASPHLRLITLASVPILILGVHLVQLAIAQYAFAVANLAVLAPPVVNLAANAALAAAGALSVRSAVLAWIAGQVLSTAIALWFVLVRLDGLGRPDLGLGWRTLSFGLKAHLGVVLTLANYRLDQWVMGILSSARQLGLYSVAVAWSEALFFLPTSLAAVQRADLARGDPATAARQTATVFRVAAVLTIAMGAVMALLAPLLCTTLFGAAFAGSVPQLRLLAVGAVGVVAMKLLGNALVAQGRPLRQTVAILSSFAAILVLDVALIPSLGGLGAAIASSVAYGFGGLVAAVVFGRTFGVALTELVPRPSDLAFVVGAARRALRARD
jgi:O-antigen/teichoic acid export membrane protein